MRTPSTSLAKAPHAGRRLANRALAWFVLACLLPAAAHAEQPRDYMLRFQEEGTVFTFDYFATGAMLTLENRTQIYGASNDVTVAVGAIPTYPLGEVFARADLRILFLSVGTTVAYRNVWRDLSFEPGDDGEYCKACDRKSRRGAEPLFGDAPGSDTFGWGEARATLYFPLNEHVVGLSTAALRYEGRRDRSYDWFFTSVYDHGLLGRWDTQLFVKHRDWGGIGPYVQLLMLPREGEHEAQWAGGFNVVTRLGLLQRNDLLFLTFLIRPGDERYGQHNYFSPVRSLLIYRMMIEL